MVTSHQHESEIKAANHCTDHKSIASPSKLIAIDLKVPLVSPQVALKVVAVVVQAIADSART